MIKCYHDSQNRAYRNPEGAVVAGTEVQLHIRAEGEVHGLQCSLHLWKAEAGEKKIPMKPTTLEDGACLFSVSAVVSETPDLCWYYFILQKDKETWYYGNNEQRLGGEGESYPAEPPGFQITVYAHQPVPAWYKESITYQIFPDRFARDEKWMERQILADRGSEWKGPRRVIQQDWNDTPFYTRNEKGEVTRWPFFGGSLQGIREKLFYLKSMGVGAIYLNPIFQAQSNHKYDTADYLKIDPAFGTEEEFRLLAQDARRLGIRLILDGVFNHTGSDSVYFNRLGNYGEKGACQGPESPYYKWYRFTDFPHEYESWWGVKDLPNVEENDPSYRAFIYEGADSVIRKWIKAGASGWRLDVADELPDDFIAGIRRGLKETDSDGLLMGEVWEDASNKISYDVQRRYFLGEELDATMHYPVRDLLTDFMLGKSNAPDAVKKLNSLAENYPEENLYGALNLIGSHDRMRILTMLGDAPEGMTEQEKESYMLPADKLALARNRLKILSLMQYALPGVPCLYYGDEAGMQGFEDPFNRGTYPWGEEDEALLAHYRTLALVRKQYSVLTSGAYRFSGVGDHVLICERYDEEKGESVIAVINRDIFGDASFALALPEGTKYVLELLSSEEPAAEGGSLAVQLPSLSARLFYCSRKVPEKLPMSRGAGVLCHVSSLPGGRLDHTAERFIDYLEEAGQTLWQILPLNPAEEMSGSPYSSPCVFAGNDKLMAPGYSFEGISYDAFCEEEAFWLEDYALYMVIKDHFDGKPWQQWPEEERERKNLDTWRRNARTEIERIKRGQFRFWSRWQEIKAYANGKGISIIGDIPIYASVDSADTWANRDVFLLGEDGYPLAGAGVPPDYFSEDGQNWGNPLYDWEHLKADDYRWWTERVSRAIKQYDYIRLDHFRSFSAFFAIPSGKKPRDGWWMPGVGKEFFDFLNEKLGPVPFLAEDLGFLDNQVHNVIKHTGCPGMLVYQFSAEEMSELPDQQALSRVFYSGTHDNQTIAGWCVDTGCEKTPEEIIEELYQSKAPWVIIPLQDLLGLGDEARMNVPGQPSGNWTWKADAQALTSELSARLKKLALRTGR